MIFLSSYRVSFSSTDSLWNECCSSTAFDSRYHSCTSTRSPRFCRSSFTCHRVITPRLNSSRLSRENCSFNKVRSVFFIKNSRKFDFFFYFPLNWININFHLTLPSYTPCLEAVLINSIWGAASSAFLGLIACLRITNLLVGPGTEPLTNT